MHANAVGSFYSRPIFPAFSTHPSFPPLASTPSPPPFLALASLRRSSPSATASLAPSSTRSGDARAILLPPPLAA
eukprot:3460879-Pleurochrysis_carterae.AAC.1